MECYQFSKLKQVPNQQTIHGQIIKKIHDVHGFMHVLLQFVHMFISCSKVLNSCHSNLALPGCARDSGSSCWCGSQIPWDECLIWGHPVSYVDPAFINLNAHAVSFGSCVSNSRFSRIAPPIEQIEIYYSSGVDMSMIFCSRLIDSWHCKMAIIAELSSFGKWLQRFLRCVTGFLLFSFMK